MKKKEKDLRFERTKMQKEMVIERLKEQGCRITKQRLILLDIILSEECSCCKEIFYEASKRDKGIGQSTVYRMVSLLEEVGAINRKNMYKISCSMDCDKKEACQIELDDNTVCHLSPKEWKDVLRAGLEQYGYVKNQEILAVNVVPCDCA
ncbi:fe2+/Zn2+ uptake regulation proteins [Clostridium sp. CAG:411]|jgi:Fur family ferric uptake transcriptional regulator|nr:transcriptional repressor [Lachnospiraceae bacterium]CDE43344.1 fe2+/Zn2+ uptake regulation proteins [Clostridium sp. CAG:411]